MKTILDYAELVKEQHALNTIIAPVEADLTSASKAYAVGQKFIHDGVLYQAKTAIAQGAALVLNTNYEAADDVSSEIQTLTNNLDDEIETRAKLGAHNLLPINVNTQTINGVTFTVTRDNSGKVTEIDANGTNDGTDSSRFYIFGTASTFEPLSVSNVPLIANGINSGSTSTYFMVVHASNSTSGQYAEAYDFYDGDENIGAFAYYKVYLGVRNGATVNHVKFYPMLRLAADKDDTYQPYAMTNRELSESDVTITPETGITIDYNCIKRVGKVVALNFRFTIASDFTIDANVKIATINPMPASSDASMLIPTATTWNGANGGLLTITKNTGDIKLVTNDFTAGNSYVVNVAYVCA